MKTTAGAEKWKWSKCIFEYFGRGNFSVLVLKLYPLDDKNTTNEKGTVAKSKEKRLILSNQSDMTSILLFPWKWHFWVHAKEASILRRSQSTLSLFSLSKETARWNHNNNNKIQRRSATVSKTLLARSINSPCIERTLYRFIWAVTHIGGRYSCHNVFSRMSCNDLLHRTMLSHRCW